MRPRLAISAQASDAPCQVASATVGATPGTDRVLLIAVSLWYQLAFTSVCPTKRMEAVQIWAEAHEIHWKAPKFVMKRLLKNIQGTKIFVDLRVTYISGYMIMSLNTSFRSSAENNLWEILHKNPSCALSLILGNRSNRSISSRVTSRDSTNLWIVSILISSAVYIIHISLINQQNA